MLAKLHSNFKEQWKNDREFSLFLTVGVFLGIAAGIFTCIFPNYLHEFYGLSLAQRGFLETPRESAGMVVIFVVGFLSFLGDIRLARVTMWLNVIGLFGFTLFAPPSLNRDSITALMVLWLFIYSLGQHVYFPLAPKIGMDLSKSANYGARLARYNAYLLGGTLAGAAFTLICWLAFSVGYQILFLIASAAYLLASFTMFFMNPDQQPKHKRPKFVYRRKYMLYYILNITNGGRKQIFLTFAPYVLISVFSYSLPAMAVLFVVITLVQMLTRRFVGRAIDTIGEQKVLTAEAALLLLICFGYGLTGYFFNASITAAVIVVCYVIDSSMSVVEMARSTYMRKIAVCDDDITPTLAAGTSIDHIASASLPALGGAWIGYMMKSLQIPADKAYQPIFIAAAGIAILNIVLTSRIKIKQPEPQYKDVKNEP